MRKAAFALVSTAVLAAVFAGALAQPRGANAGLRLYPDPAVVVKQIDQYRSTTWHWQRVMGMHTTPVTQNALDPSLQYRLWVRDLWKARASFALQAGPREAIAKEGKALTDHDVQERLETQGIHIARRTVSKYRIQLDILPSALSGRECKSLTSHARAC